MFYEFLRRQLGALAVLASALAFVTADARAGDPDGGVDYYSTLSCKQLWYERNSIYARFGHCFTSERAIATFGRGCQPPYGKLPANLSRVVRDIEAWEKRRGC